MLASGGKFKTGYSETFWNVALGWDLKPERRKPEGDRRGEEGHGGAHGAAAHARGARPARPERGGGARRAGGEE